MVGMLRYGCDAHPKTGAEKRSRVPLQTQPPASGHCSLLLLAHPGLGLTGAVLGTQQRGEQIQHSGPLVLLGAVPLHLCEVGAAAAAMMQNKAMPSAPTRRDAGPVDSHKTWDAEEASSVTPAWEKLPAEALSYSHSCASCC